MQSVVHGILAKDTEVMDMTPHELALKMQEHLAEHKKKPKTERVAIATERLIREGVIDENGEFTDHYAYSREYYKNKAKDKAKA
jgi:hypothetical protein